MKIKFFLSLFTLLFIANGCVYNPYNYTYIQTPVNVPNLEKKGDLHADGYLWHNHADLQASYAPFKNIGVMASYNQGFKNSIQYAELGGGYFSSNNHRLRTHLFAGAGLGNLSVGYTSKGRDYETQYVFDLNSHYYKLFIQPSIGVNFSEDISLTTTVKISYVTFQSYSYLVDYYNYDSIGNARVIYDTWKYHVEPTSQEQVYIFDFSNTLNRKLSNRFSFLATLNFSFVLNDNNGSLNAGSPFTAIERPRQYSNKFSDDKYIHPIYSHLGVHIGLRWKLSTRKS